jgi:uncharacterized protein (TIGR02217 family)
MAHRNVLFPVKVSRGATVTPVYNTTINQAGNAREIRNVEWSRGLMNMSVSAVLKDKPTIADMIAFFRAVAKGSEYSFDFRDPHDLNAGIDLSDGSASAHNFAVGDGATTEFKLYKVYSYGGFTEARRIQRPKDPILVYLDDVLVPDTDYTVDYTIGKITFDVAPAIDADIGWSGEFYTAVRIEGDRYSMKMDATSAVVDLQLWEVLLPE